MSIECVFLSGKVFCHLKKKTEIKVSESGGFSLMSFNHLLIFFSFIYPALLCGAENSQRTRAV